MAVKGMDLTVSGDERMIGKVTRIGVLYDFYGALLTERQREMVELHYFDDWSLAEIAEHVGTSRQAVHDNLRRAEEQLEAYERALRLLAQHDALREQWDSVCDAWRQARVHVPVDVAATLDERLSQLRTRSGFATGRDVRA